MKYGKVYFLGIGGIGMSAEARYFLHEGRRVAGYDRTPSELTAELRREGAEVTYDESSHGDTGAPGHGHAVQHLREVPVKMHQTDNHRRQRASGEDTQQSRRPSGS